jgi:4'-phosphopantetheinyl transferase
MQCELQLRKDLVDVWSATLDADEPKLAFLRGILSPEESAKAERMRFAHVRKAFESSRGLLRLIVGTYLNANPIELRFHKNEYGKPSLVDEYSRKWVSFNMSHSHGMALYAVGLERQMGVDIEIIREDMRFLDIAERFFSPREYEVLKSLPPDQIRRGFFNCWTRKEAYIKAKGASLSSMISHFQVSLIPGEPAALLDFPMDPEEISRWTFANLELGPDYAGALVVEGKDMTIRQRDFQKEVGIPE